MKCSKCGKKLKSKTQKYTRCHDGGFDGYNYVEELLEPKREDLDGNLYCEECYKTIDINEQVVDKIKKELVYKINMYEKAIESFKQWYLNSLDELVKEYEYLSDINKEITNIVSLENMDKELIDKIMSDKKIYLGSCQELNSILNSYGSTLFLSQTYLKKLIKEKQ